MSELHLLGQKVGSDRRRGFTIVELLIVIVVIGILAAITVVAYTGINQQASATALKSDLAQAKTQLEIARVSSGDNTYPTSPSGTNPPASLKPSPKTTLQYTVDNTSNPATYCLSATNDTTNQAFHLDSTTGTPQDGVCTGHTAPSGGASTEIANNSPIQDITPVQCAALPIFTGSNESAVRTVTDARGGTTRTYEVAKLADDNCWMLSNLKLGLISGTITLTPSDSNVASNFTLPQLITAGAADPDNPAAYGPVTGDTGIGTTNYGYLYNWPAATAGESTASHPSNAGDAPYSICPANWRLPTGKGTGEFAMLNAKMNDPSATTPSTSSSTGFYENWQPSGPFKGVFTGNWYSPVGFYDQGSNGSLWSASPHATADGYAWFMKISGIGISTASTGARSSGFGVRCLLN